MRSNKEIFRWDVWNNNTIEVVDASMATRGLDRHFHDSWTFGHIMQGQCQFESGGFKHLAPEGSLFIIPPLEVHTSSADDANVKYRVVYIQDAIVNTLAPPLHTFMMSHYQRVWVNSGSMIQKLCDTLENGAELNSTWTDNLHRIISSTANPKRRYAPSELQEIINQSWDKNLGITALESFIGRSRWQTIRNFKKTIGMTPSSYLVGPAKFVLAQ
jgi:hypothetical protein